jgi:hypothetical protein
MLRRLQDKVNGRELPQGYTYALMRGQHIFMSETSYSIDNIVSVCTLKAYKGAELQLRSFLTSENRGE